MGTGMVKFGGSAAAPGVQPAPAADWKDGEGLGAAWEKQPEHLRLQGGMAEGGSKQGLRGRLS